MYKPLKELQIIAERIGRRPDLVQGSGGNMSVKIDRRWMLIKASGVRLDRVNAKKGLTLVNFLKIKEYHAGKVRKRITKKHENAAVQCIAENTKTIFPKQDLKASIETGFHSFLDKYVIHTHSVYANIINCSPDFKSRIEEIEKLGKLPKILFIPYCNPGLSLTVTIGKEAAKYLKKYGKLPAVLFLQNHGLIVSGKDMRGVLNLHEKVNAIIKEAYETKPYPGIRLRKIQDAVFLSNTSFLRDMLAQNKALFGRFRQKMLFPDQIVFCKEISFDARSKKTKIHFNFKDKTLTYHAGETEARAMEETIAAWAYIMTELENKKVPAKTIPDRDILYITDMESEKHRMRVIKSGL